MQQAEACDLDKFFATNVRATFYHSYANEEELLPRHGYPRGYRCLPIDDQIKALVEAFQLDPGPSLEFAQTLHRIPTGAEGWFAIPRHKAIASTYRDAFGLVMEATAASRNCSLYWADTLEDYIPGFHLMDRSACALELLSASQPGDILVVGAQLGLRHRGRSARRATECLYPNEFHLGPAELGAIVLSHPKRFAYRNDLNALCAGAVGDDTSTPRVLSFVYVNNVRGLGLSAVRTSETYSGSGAASALMPHP